jgi:hypothetical protein
MDGVTFFDKLAIEVEPIMAGSLHAEVEIGRDIRNGGKSKEQLVETFKVVKELKRLDEDGTVLVEDNSLVGTLGNVDTYKEHDKHLVIKSLAERRIPYGS